MRALIGLILLMWPGVAGALEICDELWFTRNALFDRAGYCFGSPLGQAVFDNSDCTTNAPDVSAAVAKQVAVIREIEVEWECNVDSNRQSLQLMNGAARLAQIGQLPTPTGYESACFGWKGEDIPLHSERSSASPITGWIYTGGDLHWQFEPKDGWEFLDPNRGDGQMGWMIYEPPGESDCESFAG